MLPEESCEKPYVIVVRGEVKTPDRHQQPSRNYLKEQPAYSLKLAPELGIFEDAG